MRNSGFSPAALWFAGIVGALLGLSGAWLATPSFLFVPIRPDSPLRALPEDAGLATEALAFVGHAGINLLHFLMWVGGSAVWAVGTTALIGSLLSHSRA